MKQYPNASTKVTYSHETLPYITESILHLFELGIRKIFANVVFEGIWEQGDNEIFEEQLDQLGEVIISSRLFDQHSCSLFSRHIGKPLDSRDDQNWCGTGKMLAIDASGIFYPCNRFTPLAMQDSSPRAIGNVSEGIDQNLLRPFLALTRSSQSPAQCMNCEVASGCAWCQGLNYQDSPTHSIYFRATHICEMHKARVRANHRFWNQVDALGLAWGEK